MKEGFIKKKTTMYKKRNNYKKEERRFENAVKTVTITIFYPEDLYYGEIKMKTSKAFPPMEEEIRDEVESRLPFFKNKKYSISIG